ncbi:hypothetical protein UlMin_019015 [Ulmus minor]
MRTATLQSSICFSSSHQPSSPFPPSNSHLPNTPLPPTKPNSLLQKHPLYAPTHKNLSLEIMGVGLGKALSRNPSLHKASLNSIQSIISFLQSKDIHQKDLISQKIWDLPKNPHFQHCLLAKDQPKPAFFYLQKLGFKDLEALAYNDAVLPVSNLENTLIPKLDFFCRAWDSKKKKGAIGIVLRCPALFTFSKENNYKPKFEYFAGDMGRKLEELIEGVSFIVFSYLLFCWTYFAFSLDKRIKSRHMEVGERGIDMELPQMLKSTDEEFAELIRQKSGRH